jgi:hypothetical protein
MFSSYEKMMIPKEQSHSGMEIKFWSIVWVKLLYLPTIPFLIFFLCLFTDVGVTIFRRSDDSIAFKGVLDGQLYLVDFNDNNVELDTCLIAKTNMGWL